jgi:hypothetical protein
VGRRSGLGDRDRQERYRRGLLARQRALEEAQRKLWDQEDPGLPDGASIAWVDGKPMLYEQWGEDIEADRRHLRKFIASVSLAEADPKRRRWQPIGERVTIRWIGE